MPDIFLSYSRDDQATARRFAEAFEREGFTVWWDQTLRSGENYDQVTEAALRAARAVVVLWSKKSVDSRWVRAEATQADRNGTLVPVMIEPCNRPIMFELKHTAELAHWKGDAGDKAWTAFVGDVRQFVKKEATGGPSPAVSHSIANHSRKIGPAVIAIGIAALLVVGAAVWKLARTDGKTGAQIPGQAIASKESTAAAPDASVAVLPFRDMSAAHDQEYFADGITEEILNSLASLHDLKVTGRTSSFAFKGKDVDLRTIGETLGVKHLLEGSVRKAGNQLRITAQLNDANTGFHLWSKTYERPMDDIFKVQEDIARSVAQALEVSLGVGDLGNRPGMTRNVEAYDAYLASIAFSEPTPDSLRAGMAPLERATMLDPTFIEAWVRLANVYAFASTIPLPGNTSQGWAARADVILEKIRGLSEYGQVVYEELAGDRSQNTWDMVAAAKHFENASRQAQELGVDRELYGSDAVFMIVTGRLAEAITILERAKAKDPLNTFVCLLLSHSYAATGNLAAAIAEEDRGIKIGDFQVPLLGHAVVVALATRDRQQIERRLAAAMGAQVDPEGLNAAMKSRLDRPADALAELHRRAAAATNQVGLSTIAIWMAWFGDAAGALDVYRSHADLFRTARRNAMPFDIWSPVMRDMRKLPGFKDLARDMGLADYWRTYGWPDLCKPVGKEDFECQ